MRALLGWLSRRGGKGQVLRREPVPAGVSEKTLVMLEAMKRKVAKESAAALSMGEGLRVDTEIDEALASSRGAGLLAAFKARCGFGVTSPGVLSDKDSPEQPDLGNGGPASAEGGSEREGGKGSNGRG